MYWQKLQYSKMVCKSGHGRNNLYKLGGQTIMQIKELVLYGVNGEVRHLPFTIGEVNIISGQI